MTTEDSHYIVPSEGYRDPKGCLHTMLATILAVVLTLILCLCFPSCKTVGTVSEQVNIRDSVAIRYQDSTRWNIRDSVHIVEHHVTIKDSTGLTIQFGDGGGTYNAKTGEATNVAGVHQTDTHHEQRDSTAHYRNLAAEYQHTADSLTNRLTTLRTEYAKVSKQTRSGYDRFCSWWFWITAILLLLWFVWWLADYIPVLKSYKQAIKTFLKIVH